MPEAIEVSASQRFLGVLETFLSDKKLSNGQRSLIQRDLQTEHISLDTFRCLQKYRPDINIHEAMRGSRVTRPHATKDADLKKCNESKERLLERNKFLQRQHETREYNRMVYGNSRLPSDSEETISSALQSVKYQAAVSSNMLAAMAGVFGVCYYAAQKFLEFNKNQCLTAGLLGAISILFVEMVLYIIRAHKMEKLQTKEGKKTDKEMKISLT